MVVFAGSLSPSSLSRNPSLIALLTKTPSLFLHRHNHHRNYHHRHLPLLNHNVRVFAKLPLDRRRRTTCTTLPSHESSSSATSTPTTTPAMAVVASSKSKRKQKRENPESQFRFKLDMCSKHGDLVQALTLYDDARSNGFLVSQHHYNVLLYLCSSSSTEVDGGGGNEEEDEERLNLGLRRGFEIFTQMGIDKIEPNEATFTSLARLAARMEDPDRAFELVKKMKSSGIPPRLRSYGPALNGFCKKREADKAYEVDEHMVASGVLAEEPEFAALLQLSSDVGRGEKVYEMLQRLRSSVRQVSESTAQVIEEWFQSDASVEVGKESWDVRKVKEGVIKGGGGWHGEGWLGKGKWSVVRTEMDETGVCRNCGEKLVCIDIDPLETENFATSLASLACKKEVMADFNGFQEWLRRHGPFDAVIDGANVGLINQHTFSFFQLSSIVNRIRELSPSKRLPLIVLHKRRVTGGPAANPKSRKLIESWQNAGALYASPIGSNDDWYWLYAAVSCKSLLVTNDEMRDHLFQLLGTSFFPRWKEKHQVRVTISRKGPTIHMPPPYSIVIQESEGGKWHIPTVTGDDIEKPRQWVCATRASSTATRARSVARIFTRKTPEKVPCRTDEVLT